MAIIGAGFSGLCLGIRLKQAGIDPFTIYEKADRLGGTWRDNTYPGAACDVPSFAYCFSFAQKTDWTRKWSPQAEILAYMDDCARRFGVLPHVRFGAEVASARFDATTGTWRLRTAAGEEAVFDVLVSAVGQLSRPWIPPLPGLDDFRGEKFHSARWNHAYALDGRTVAVVGNAASAIQLVPQIAPRVRRLYVLQRSANWVVPRGDRAYTEREKRRFARHPWLARLYRWWLWFNLESRFYPVIRRHRVMSALVERYARRYLAEQVADPAMRAALVPDYPVGGKRLLISDDYYQALGRQNVELVTSPIARFTADAVVTADGRRRAIDCAILATGFRSTEFLAPIRIEGRDGRVLEDEWQAGARGYLGLTVAGFPNFFMMYGPNTNLGHNSIIFMIECQAQYVMDCLRQMRARELAWIDVRRDAMEAYNARIQRALAGSVWAATGKSWYKTADGTITNNWPGTTVGYWWATRRADLRVYEAATRAALAAATTGAGAAAA
ncbi:MAG TPA: NAD(P)/FAD-dependent oxidoreductase [Candidatus Binatia bacterium]|nr:NAD(P)/FAD-dependent oxidoreductase [Candidatus Binatia bacterium]